MELLGPKIIGFLDLGTNSVRLLVVRLHPNGSYTLLNQQKEVIRLGEGGFVENRLEEKAIHRAVGVISRLIELARSRGAEEFVAVATSATRDATNGEDLCDRIEEISGVRIHIISGEEEARLIWLGVSSAVDLRDDKALFIDIGGGSTEVIIGDQNEPHLLRSLKLGAIRTTSTFFPPDFEGVVSEETIAEMRRFIDDQIVHVVKKLQSFKVSRAFGSSGTILSLEAIAAGFKPLAATHTPGFLSVFELEQVIRYLSSLPLQVRRSVQGLNPERADIIIAGAVILHEILKAGGCDGVTISQRSLRDGQLVDYISKIPGFPHAEQVPVREKSVRHLGRSCHIDETHAAHITDLCLQLYDSGILLDIFSFPETAREILMYASHLHDVGQFISFSDHHHHSFYLITHVPLLGFNQHEILLIALTARHHRKKMPRTRDGDFNELKRDERRLIRVLSLLLRIAEHLDRSHDQRVKKVEFIRDADHVLLSITCNGDCSLEAWAVESDKEAFNRVIRKPLRIIVDR